MIYMSAAPSEWPTIRTQDTFSVSLNFLETTLGRQELLFQRPYTSNIFGGHASAPLRSSRLCRSSGCVPLIIFPLLRACPSLSSTGWVKRRSSFGRTFKINANKSIVEHTQKNLLENCGNILLDRHIGNSVVAALMSHNATGPVGFVIAVEPNRICRGTKLMPLIR